MLQASDDFDDLLGPTTGTASAAAAAAAPMAASAASAGRKTLNATTTATLAVNEHDDDDDELDRELGLSSSSNKPTGTSKAKLPSESMEVPDGVGLDNDAGSSTNGAASVDAAAVSASTWLGGWWNAASSAVASAAEQVQNNAEVSKALESARQRAQEAMSAMNSDKLLTTVASYTEVAKQATGAALSQVDAALTSVDKLIELVDPSNQDDLFDEEDYDPVLAVGKVKVIVTSAHPAHVAAVVDVFESVHGVDSVFAKGSPTDSAIAKQPVGFEAGLKGAQARVESLLQSTPKLKEENFLAVGIESFIVKIGETWFEASAIVLHDTKNNLSMHTFTQTTQVETELVKKCLDLTPATYVRKDTGLSVTVASLIVLNAVDGSPVDEGNWHTLYHDGRISLQQIIGTALLGLYGRYWRHLQSNKLVALNKQNI